MKVNDIVTEMTMRAGNLDKRATDFADTNAQRWYQGKHVGDIDSFVVKKDGIYFSVWDGDTLIAFSSVSTQNPVVVDDVWVNGEYRGQKILSKLLWFYKSRLGHDKLILGDVHSKDTTDIIIGGGLSRFTKLWINIRTNQTEPYDPATVDSFYSWVGPTPWRLMLENDGDFTDWPVFNTGPGYIKQSYDWQIE